MPTAPPAELEVVPCPACGDERWTAVRTAGNPTLDPQYRFDVVRCAACGFHFTNPRPTLATLGDFYPPEYANYQKEDGTTVGKPGSLRNLVLRDAFGAPSQRPTGVSAVVAKLGRCVRSAESFGFGLPWRGQGRLLDFGCGSGEFLRRMHALGWNVTGIDFGEEAVKRVREAGLHALQGTIPHPELKPASFDVVTMRQALEHVPDPRETLRAAWALLDRGGLLLIDVPNYGSWEMEKFGEASMLLDLPRHLNHFTPATLEALLKREGMTHVQVKQVSRASWLRKAAKRVKKGEETSLSGMLKRPLGARVAATIAGWRGRGNEIIATAEKDV